MGARSMGGGPAWKVALALLALGGAAALPGCPGAWRDMPAANTEVSGANRDKPGAIASVIRPGGAAKAGRGAEVRLQLAVTPSRYVEMVVSPYTADSIARLEVVPYIAIPGLGGGFVPINKVTGQPDSSPGAAVVKATQASPSVDVSLPVVFGNLESATKYRFYARAYDSRDAMISADNTSFVDLDVTDSERPTLASLPLRLINRSFSATTSVTLTGSVAGKLYDHVLTELFKISGGSATAVSGATGSAPGPYDGQVIALTGLKPHTTYRLKTSVVQATGDILATSSVDIVVTDDDSPATQSLAPFTPSP